MARDGGIPADSLPGAMILAVDQDEHCDLKR
jgi:hypothetical protein